MHKLLVFILYKRKTQKNTEIQDIEKMYCNIIGKNYE